MAHSTVLALAVILLALSGYYLTDWWLEENQEKALDLVPSTSLTKPFGSDTATLRGHSKETSPQEFSAGTVWYLQCLSISICTCITVSSNVWIFFRERRDREARERRDREKKEEKRREKEEREQRHLEEMEERRRLHETMLQLIRKQEDREVTERRKKVDELKRFLAEKREAMVQHIKDLRAIADAVDKFHKGASIAKLTGTSVSAAGGIISIVGLALIPFTLGASLVVSAVGAGVAVTGGVTNVAAGAAEAKSNSTDKKDVQEILRSSTEDLDGVWKVIDEYAQYILTQVNDESRERLLKELEDIKWEFFNVTAMGNNNFKIDASNFVKNFIRSLTLLITSLLDDIIRAAAAGAAKAGARAAAGTAAKATGIAGAIFLPLDIFDIVRGSINMHKGAKSDMASKIREIADKMERLIMRRPQGNAILGTERRKEITDSPKGGHEVEGTMCVTNKNSKT